jgi:cobalt-zinc-cadmium efflux system outer membrane protein
MTSRPFQLLLVLQLLVTVAGCAAPRLSAALPARRPLGSAVVAYEAPAASQGPSPGDSILSEPAGDLTLQQAVTLSLLHSPRLAAASWEIRAGEARMLQARSWPNPELEVEIEEFGGSGQHRSFRAAQTTVRLSQLIELGGKRSARIRLAAADAKLAGWDYEAERLSVLTEVTLGFVDVLAAQKRLRLAEDIHRLEEETSAAVADRVIAGKVSPLEQTKATVTMATSKIEVAKAQSDLRVARMRLAASWGSTQPRFLQAIGDLDKRAEIPSLEALLTSLERNPDIARWADLMNRNLAALASERAGRVPDLVLGLGGQRFQETRDHALVASLGAALPLFDRNRGSILEQRSRRAQLEHGRRETEVRTAARLTETYESLTAARFEATALEQEVVPAAEQALAAARAGYARGKFGYLELLDAQRTSAAAKVALLDAQARYNRALAILESLVGASLESFLDRGSMQKG